MGVVLLLVMSQYRRRFKDRVVKDWWCVVGGDDENCGVIVGVVLLVMSQYRWWVANCGICVGLVMRSVIIDGAEKTIPRVCCCCCP